MEINQQNIFNVRNLIRHRFYYFLIPFLLLITLALAVTFILPVQYESSVTMLSEKGNIPADLVQDWSSNFVDQRMDELQQVINSRNTLTQVIERNGLYKDFLEKHTMEKAIGKLKENISYETTKTDMVNPGGGRPVQSLLTFVITFKNKDPEVASKVTAEMASLYIDRNSMAIERQFDETMSFLESEHQRLESSISSLEGEIAEFKKQHVDEMPELMTTTLQTKAKLETDIETQLGENQNLRERRLELEGSLRKTDPYGSMVQSTGEKVVSPEESLDTLRFEYISKRSSMSEKHPDIISLKKQITELEKVVSRKSGVTEVRKQLNLLETRYSEMSARMSADHPDLVKLRGDIASLRESLNGLTDEISSAQEEVARDPDNPAYIEFQTQLAIVDLDIQESLSSLATVRGKLASYSRRVRTMPGVEEEYLALTRNYESLKAEYQSVNTKLNEASKAKSLETDRKGERFAVLEPATVPQTPTSPNIPVFLSLGFLLSFLVGLGTVYLTELMDSTVNSVDELRQATDLPVFTSIPFIDNRENRQWKFFRRVLVVTALIAVLALAALVVGYYLVNFT